jgi:hypothetical protein
MAEKQRPILTRAPLEAILPEFERRANVQTTANDESSRTFLRVARRSVTMAIIDRCLQQLSGYRKPVDRQKPGYQKTRLSPSPRLVSTRTSPPSAEIRGVAGLANLSLWLSARRGSLADLIERSKEHVFY